jgi:plasmid rolling circle replication initiator protein Rep
MNNTTTSQMICQEVDEILQDKSKNGKLRPWRPKKVRSLILADSYERIGNEVAEEYRERGVHRRYTMQKVYVTNDKGFVINIRKIQKGIGLYDEDGKRVVDYVGRAENVRNCGTYLEFSNLVDGRQTLKTANFCRVPLCPMCQWRKSLKVFCNVSKIMDEAEAREPNFVPLFLTLTVKNCAIDSLSETLDSLLPAWNLFLSQGQIKPIVKGWFRALEVTYNEKEKTFHPHIHAIVLVDKSYFKSEKYLQTSDFVKIWRRSAKLDYDPICDIRRTKTPKGQRKEVAEVAKYTLKDSEIFKKGLAKDKTDELVKSMSQAFHGRQLYAFGGLMSKIAKEMKTDKPDEGDLVHVDGKVRADLVVSVKRYQWNFGRANYFRVGRED